MRRTVFACLATLLLSASVVVAAAAPATHAGYRLAGIMAAGDSYLGFLELPQGAQVLVRLGSIVDGGKVIAFDADSLRIRFPDGVVELTLEGTGKPPTQSRHDVVVSGDEQGHVIRREVDPGELDAALAETGAAGKRKGGPAPSASQVVAERFAPLLDLPSGARVVAVNEQPVGSADAAIDLVQDTLAKGMPARLNLQTADGLQRVYLRPASHGSAPPKKP
jgi:hypothetical protein